MDTQNQAGDFRLSTKRPAIVIRDDPRIKSVVPHKPIIRGDRRYLLIAHKPDATKVLNNFGYPVPPPILTRYDWAGQTPFDSQRATAAMLTAYHRAYVLNEMGTGKTLASLFAFDFLKKMGAANKMLVVAPLSTLNVVWMHEIFARLPHLEAVVLHGTRQKRHMLLEQDADIYIINHDGLKTFCKEKRHGRTTSLVLGDALKARPDIDVVLIDELGIYRNKSTDRWKSAAAALEGRKWGWGMTGGPIPKAPTDAWAQMRLLTPENTTWSFRQFREEVMYQVNQFKWLPKNNALETVHKQMHPSVRYTRAECMDLPPTTYSDRMAKLSKEQHTAYTEMLKEYCFNSAAGEVTALNAGVRATKLLQICCGFVYGNTDLNTGHRPTIRLDHRARIDVVEEVVDQSEGKVIVFVPYKEAISLVANGLKGKVTTATISGDTPKRERDTTFALFQHSPNPKVLIAHPKVMSHGLTLTAASTILWYAVLPDLEIYDQACARVTRPGQVRHTHIIHIVSTKTEQDIANVLQKRGNVQQALLDMFTRDRGATMLKALAGL